MYILERWIIMIIIIRGLLVSLRYSIFDVRVTHVNSKYNHAGKRNIHNLYGAGGGEKAEVPTEGARR